MRNGNVFRRATRCRVSALLVGAAVLWGAATVNADMVQPDQPNWAWAFDDGAGATTAAAAFGSVDGTVVGAVDSASTHFTYDGNRSFDFDGTDDRVDVPGINISGGNNNAVTVSAWIYSETSSSSTDRAHIFGNWFQGSQALQSIVLYGSGDLIRLMVDTPSGTQSSLTATLPKNQWVHVVGVWDGKATNDGFRGIYLNGTLANSANTASVLNNLTDEGTYGIGMDSGSTDQNRFFDGKIDELAVWKTALSADNVSWLYNNSITAIVPEPSSMVLLCLAGPSILLWRRGRKN